MRSNGLGHNLRVVDPSSFSPAECEAFSSLLDDPNQEVRRQLLAYFGAHPDAAQVFLGSLSEARNRVLAWHARWFLTELRFSDPVAEFRGFIQSLNYELETGAILLARTVLPLTDVVACTEALDRLAARCRELLSEPVSSRERCRVLNRVLFHESGFRGNRENYEDPLNSFLPSVLERRKGIPVSLCLIYLLVAQRIGMELEPVGLPGRFMVGCFTEAQPFFIDAFDQGAFRSPADLLQLVRSQGTEPHLSDLAPTPVREVLARCCRNLVNHYAGGGDIVRSRLFQSFVEDFESAYDRNVA